MSDNSFMEESSAVSSYTDFFHAPEIEEVDLEGYSGKTGELIKIKARDDVQVTRVAVLISDEAGNEIV